MNPEALDRLHDFLQDNKINAALFSNPATVTWLTGYAPPIQTGPSPFEGGPALAWWQAGEVTLVLSDAEAAAGRLTETQVKDYLSYTIEEPLVGYHKQAAALSSVLGEDNPLTGTVGVEMNSMPASLMPVLHDAFPRAALQPIDGTLDSLRAVKTPEEISKVREALRLCDLAQYQVTKLAKPGMSEIELWGMLKSCLEVDAGMRLPILADLVAGARTAEIGGLPGTNQLKPGDAIIADIVPRLSGYWGDNCGTHFIGDPSQKLMKIYQVVLAALRKGVEAVRPGMRACDLDTMLRDTIREQGYPVYPHHSGHGLGVTFHEEPRLVPYNDLALKPGMILAIEPGIYIPGVGGVRLEDVVLVTQDGCEVLTRHLL